MSYARNLIVTVALSVFVLLLAVSPARAAVLGINGIAPFDTNLGTLTSVTVTINPIPQSTSIHTTNFDNVDNHLHQFNLLPTAITGLGSFNYTPVFTSVGSSPAFGSHDHTLDVPASVKVFSGGNLAWFLNPASPTINSVTYPVQNTSTAEDHNHTVFLSPAVPHTVYTYDPVPEPASLALFGLGGAMVLRRRR